MEALQVFLFSAFQGADRSRGGALTKQQHYVMKGINTMNQTANYYETTGFDKIRLMLSDYANTRKGKQLASDLEPYLSESELYRNLRETTQARTCMEELGAPPIPCMEDMEEKLLKAVRGEMLTAEEIEQTGTFLAAVHRMKGYLEKGKEKQIGLAFYSDNLVCLDELAEEIARSIRNGKVDDYASNTLKDLRRSIELKEQEVKEKAERLLKSNKSILTDQFVVTRNGRVCLPVKKEHKSRIPGSVIDASSTGATVFLEPAAVAGLREELELLRIDEDSEERRILYLLADQIAEQKPVLTEDIHMIEKLDFLFAKGKMSMDFEAVEPVMNTERRISLSEARHPMLSKETCVPLDFYAGEGTRGVIITGPNTGGKTVAIKTVALFCLMAGAGLHVPCKKAEITMNSQVLCDIGDGQNMADNLSTFSAHITNVMSILKRVNRESLVILDELGSGTDPAEGMGIAIAILEELRKSGCLFLVTTHYPEVKEYAARYPEIVNARMGFDRESLKPLYRLEIGKAGESCALYIAKRLGVPAGMLKTAAEAAYGTVSEQMKEELSLDAPDTGIKKEPSPRIEKRVKGKKEAVHGREYVRGDSVSVLPEGKIGIVVKPADRNGDVLVQIHKEKMLVSHKRLKLKVAAAELYPEDYDFSIIFDTVENRKARHKLEKGYQGDLTVEADVPGI